MPLALVLLVLLLCLALVAIVAYKYLHDRNARGGWRIGAAGRYQRVVEMPSPAVAAGAVAGAVAGAASGRDAVGGEGYQARGVA